MGVDCINGVILKCERTKEEALEFGSHYEDRAIKETEMEYPEIHFYKTEGDEITKECVEDLYYDDEVILCGIEAGNKIHYFHEPKQSALKLYEFSEYGDTSQIPLEIQR